MPEDHATETPLEAQVRRVSASWMLLYGSMAANQAVWSGRMTISEAQAAHEPLNPAHQTIKQPV